MSKNNFWKALFNSSEKRKSLFLSFIWIIIREIFVDRVIGWINDMIDIWLAANPNIFSYIFSLLLNAFSWMFKDSFHASSGVAVLVILYIIFQSWKETRLVKNINVKENENIGLLEPKLVAHQCNDEIQGDYIFKQLQITNRIHQKALSSYATIHELYMVNDDGTNIPITPLVNELSWARSNSEIINNRANLVNSISKKLYMARINTIGLTQNRDIDEE